MQYALARHGVSQVRAKNLREVTYDDFCYFVTLDPFRYNLFEANLKEQNIPIATLGSGIAFARRTSAELHVFIPYGCFDRARNIRRYIRYGRMNYGYIPKKAIFASVKCKTKISATV